MTTSNRPTGAIVSGFFSPLHEGHLDMIEAAAALADTLVVIVNNNEQQLLKKGQIIMDEQVRLRIVSALRVVDDAFIAVDDDRTVCASLALVAQKYPDHHLIFANGGDRVPGFVPEEPVCEEYGIEMVFGVGGTEKADSSTRINMALGIEDTPSAPPSATS
ncbi:MAG: adenylyltransferase/cytidyltransferase family protein [Actinomycetota bacterium]